MECIAPGFRFHPTDEELIVYYLKRKICRKKLRVNAIGETDVYKYDPQDLPGKASYKSRDRQWFFFSLRDKKCGGRGTENGYWKATGNDKEVMCNSRLVGMRKTLVFHRGKAPKGERTDWVMHEYSLVEEELKNLENVTKGYYVVNKVFKKSGSGPKNGAQYGAPFIEEEWVDDDDDVEDVIESADVDVSANQLTVDNRLVNGLSQSELDGYDIEDLMRQVREEPSHVGDLVGPTLQLGELSGVESPVETFNPTNLSRDAYLEIDDLLLSGPEPGSVEAVPENWDLDVSDDVENNRFFDVDSYFLDMDAADPNSSSDPQSEHVRIGLANGVEQQPASVTDQATNDQVQQQTVVNQASDWPLAKNVAMSSRMWTQELNNDVLTDTQFVKKPLIVPGTGDASESMNPLSDISTANKDDSSQFTSSLWDFLESIPASPAYASENPFLNKTQLRTSSHGHVNVVVTVNNDLAAKSMKRRENNKIKKNKSFFFLSIIGALCAVFWVCVGTVGFSRRFMLS